MEGKRLEISSRKLGISKEQYVRGVCNFLSSVLLQQRFEMANQCYSSIIAQSLIQQRIVYP